MKLTTITLCKYFKRLGGHTIRSVSRRRFMRQLIASLGVAAFMPRGAYTAEPKPTVRAATTSENTADLLLYNGKVITLDHASRVHEAVAIRGSKIIAVGENAALAATLSPDTRRIDLEGNSVLPGLFDCHPHMNREGLKSRGGLPLLDVRSVADIVEQVARAAATAKPGEWIVFMPMGKPPFDYINDAAMLKEGRFPNRLDLDAVAPDNPVYIRNVWGWWSRPPYPAIANSAALRVCGINAATADPYNIKIVRDRKHNPTGVFLETNRTSLLEYTLFRAVPRFTYDDQLASVRTGSAIYSSLGTTSAYEAHGLSPALIRAHEEIAAQGELAVRMTAPLSLPTSALSRTELSEMLAQWAPKAGERGSSTANFRDLGVTLDHGNPNVAGIVAGEYPYEQWSGHFSQGLSEAEFIDIGTEAAKHRLRLNFVIASAPPYHDINKTLHLLEQIDKQAPIRDLRCVGFHLTNANAQQLRRVRELGLVVTMTPSFFYSQTAQLHLDKLGQDAKPMREVLDAGIPLVLGSDNVPPSMLFTCWEALERWDEVGQRHIGESHLTREEALRMSCQTPHYLNWEEDSRGMISKGRFAELVVLNGDPLNCELRQLPKLEALMTIVDGRILHDARAGREG